MLKLSAKAANNVVIFAVLLMMLLFNLDALLPNRVHRLPTRLVAEEARVLKITQGAFALERVGEQLRWHAPIAIVHDPYDMLAAWQNAELEALSISPELVPAMTEVRVWQSGRRDASIFVFWLQDTELYVSFDDHAYRVKNVTFQELLPWSSVIQ